MRTSSHAIGIWCTVLLLAVSASPAFASSVSVGSWQLDSDLNASAARAVLAQFTFTPQAQGDGSAWTVSSSAYVLSDGAGGIGPSSLMASDCAAFFRTSAQQPDSAACTSSSDIYQRVDERLVHVGRLRFHSNSLFDAPPSQSGSFNYPTSGAKNQSGLPAGPDVALALPQEWLWVIAAVIVLVLTLAFVLRNRD